MRKIYVVGSVNNYARWMEGAIVQDLEDADLVVFTGGEDVHPDFYGQPSHPQTYSNKQRDRYEMKIYEAAIQKGKHIIGICRGSQFLCVANGGHLVQHQDNPHYIHPINMLDGTVLDITSTHHQAAYPFVLPKDEYHILGWTEGISPFHEDGNKTELNPEKECEIVYYPKSKCLGIQGHPESMPTSHETIAYLRKLLNAFLINKIDIYVTKEESSARSN
jgi:GMP synthase-like glutamine amidotransferase